MDPPKAIVRGTRRVDRKGGAREIRSPRVVVLVGVACAGVHGVGRALLPHLPTHTHTVRQTTVGMVTWVAVGAPRAARGSVHDGVGGDGDREDGVAMCRWRLVWMKGLTTLRSFFDFCDLGIHLNGPLASVSI